MTHHLYDTVCIRRQARCNRPCLALWVCDRSECLCTTTNGCCCCCCDPQSPLITDKYPLHKAVAYYDLPGVKAAVANGADVSLSVRVVHGGKEERYTSLRVAIDSFDTCGMFCEYYPKPVTDIIAFLLCSGG